MANKKKYLVDTSVIIALFRGSEDAKQSLSSLKPGSAYICDITMLEILTGCSTSEKREAAIQSLDVFGLLLGSDSVSNKAIQLMKRYCVRRTGQPQMMLPDCLIASYSTCYDMTLLTFNKKDFEFIQEINLHPQSK